MILLAARRKSGYPDGNPNLEDIMTKPKIKQEQQAVVAAVGPFEIDITQLDVRDLAAGETRITVESMSGPDAYHTFEVDARHGGGTIGAYRTVQRIDLATRLRVPVDYEPLDLVGRTFLVAA